MRPIAVGTAKDSSGVVHVVLIHISDDYSFACQVGRRHEHVRPGIPVPLGTEATCIACIALED